MKKYFTSIIFFLFSASMLLGQGPYYVNLDDASGFDRSPYQTQLESAAAEIIEVLPEEYQSQFKVFDFGFYLHAERFEEGVEQSLEHAKLLAAAQSPFYLLFAKQTDQTGLYSRFYVEVELPRTAPGYPCLTENLSEVVKTLTLISTQTHYEGNGKSPTTYASSEIQGMTKFLSKVNRVFNCCDETENITCSAFGNNREEADLLTSIYIKPDERFIELKNIDNIQITPQSYSSIVSEKKIIFDLEIKDGQTSEYSRSGYNLTDSLNNVASLANNINEFDVNVIYVDESSYSEEFMSNLLGSPDQTNNAPPPVVDGTFYEPSSYHEDIVVLDLEPGVPPIILSRIRVEYEVAQGINSIGPNDPRNEELAEFIVPVIVAKIGQEIIRRAFMASLNVGINIGMTVAIEKVWGHDDCTWGQAFWAAKITGWHLAIWTTEGLLSGGNPVKDIIIGGVAAAAAYVLTAPSDNFQVTKVFSTFATGIVLGGAFNFLGEYIGKAWNRYVKKVDDEGGSLLNLTRTSFAKASDEFFDAKYFTKNIEDGFFDGLYRWFRSVDALRDFKDLNSKGWCIDLMKKYKAQFTDVNNSTIREGITDAAEGATQRRGLLKYCIDGLGCFVENTPVLMAANANQFSYKNTGKALIMATALPIATVPIQEVQLLDYTVAHETVNSTYEFTASTNEHAHIELIGKDPYTSDQQRQRDEYKINDTDWNEVVFEQVNGSSTAKLALHNDWINQKGYHEEAVVNLNLPEQGINGPFRITSIKHILPQKKPTDEDKSDDFDYRPVTAIFTHVSDQVYNLEFDNGENLGVTFQHPIYSVTAGDWQLAGELKIGEEVLTKSGTATVVCSERQEGSEVVYNLEIQDLHNFLVGESGVVVHNNCLNILEDYLSRLGRRFAKPGGTRFPNDRPNCNACKGGYVEKLDGNGNLRKLYVDENEFPFFEEFAKKNSSGNVFKYESDYLKGYPKSLPEGHIDDFKDANNWLQNNLNQIAEPIQFPNGENSSFLRILKDGQWNEYTWHHHQDGKTLLLVERAIHNGTGHTGGGLLINVGLKGVLPGPIEP